MLHPPAPTALIGRTLEHLREFYGRLCGLMMPAFPDRIHAVIKAELAAESAASNEASVVAMFGEVWHQVSPGGSLELNGLQAFIRNPGGVNTG